MLWLYTLLSVGAVGLVSFVGVFTLALNEKRLRAALFLLVALATGALFGDVLIHLLPEIFESAEKPLAAALTVLGGILLFFVLEKFLHWHHAHGVDDCAAPEHHHSARHLGHLNLLADGLHNFLDGLIIGASYLASPTIGLASTLAVVLHEIPQEIGDFAILLHSGFSRRRALFLNFISAMLAGGGALLALILGGRSSALVAWLPALAAGGFLYLAGSDLVPELHKTTELKKSLLQFAAMLVGIALMAALVWIE